MPNKRVLVVGASRGLGLHALQRALEANYDVTAFARSAEKIELEHSKLTKVSGNAQDQNDLRKALVNVDVVIQTLGVSNRALMRSRRVSLFSQSTRLLIQAMEETGPLRLVAVTGFGAGDSRNSMSCFERIPFRLVLGRAYDDKDRQEALIRDSKLAWTIVRPAVLTNGPPLKSYSVLETPESWHNGLISRRSVADFLVRQVEDQSFIGKSVVLANR
jgi:putative NADH-flavin reductase